MQSYNCDELATTCEKDHIYKIVSNNNGANNAYYHAGKMIKIIKVTEAFVPEQGDTTSAIVPKSYEAKATANSASLGFLQDDLNKNRLKLKKCTLLEKESGSDESRKRSRSSLPAPAAGGKRTKKTIKRRRKGRKRRTRRTKRNKRQ